jgi:hypothetical protein
MKEWFRFLERRYEDRPRQFEQPPTLIRRYCDELFQGGDVVFLYARPQVGTTALLLKLLVEFSDVDRPVLYASDRTDSMQFMARLMTMIAGISLTRLVDGQLFSVDWGVLTKCALRLSESNIYYADHYELDPLEISQKMRLWRYQQKNHRGLLLYDDYTDQSLMGSADVERTIGDLKLLAQETNSLLVVTVKLGDVPLPDDDLERLFSFTEYPGEQFSNRIVMKNVEDGVVVRMMSCPNNSGYELRLGYNQQTDALEYFL